MRDTCGWCNAPLDEVREIERKEDGTLVPVEYLGAKYCGQYCLRRSHQHETYVSIAEERRANKVDKLQKIRALCDALENGGPEYDGARLLDAGLLTWWSVTMSHDEHGIYELVTAADRNASVPWALPPPRRGDRAWLIETLREVWLPKARAYLARQGDGVR